MAKSKLLSKIRTEIRRRNYSYQMEQIYIGWMIRFVHYHDLQHPDNLREREVVEYLNHLANERVVTPSIQEQAQCAISFYYEYVIQEPLQKLEGIIIANDTNFVPPLTGEIG